MLRKRTGAVMASAVAVAMLLTACGSSSSGGSAGGATTLTLGSLVVPADYSADALPWANDIPLRPGGLRHPGAGGSTGNIQPWLATSWTYNDDKTVLTLKLRTGVKFTDGTAFGATAAAQNLTRFETARRRQVLPRPDDCREGASTLRPCRSR